jgi:hypothetical protein
MEILIKRVSIFTSVFIVMLLTILISIIYWINKPKYYRISDKYTSIIMGHSHPECALNDSLLNGFKNYAESGEAYIYTYYKLRKILEVNPEVKNIFIEFTNDQIDIEMNKWVFDDKFISEKFSKYYPIISMGAYLSFLEKNPASTLNALVTGTIENSKFLSKDESSTFMKWGGYRYLRISKVDSIIKKLSISTLNNQRLSEINISYLKKIIQLCNEKNKNIYLIRSPIHKKYFELVNEKQFQQTLEKNFSATPFLDFGSVPLKNEEFLDLEHLNSYGAQKFSKLFNNFVNQRGLVNKNPQMIIDSLIIIHTVNE